MFSLSTTRCTGYIKLTEFNAQCKRRVREAVAKLEADGATRLVLDLRGNRLSKAACEHLTKAGESAVAVETEGNFGNGESDLFDGQKSTARRRGKSTRKK